MYWSSMHKAEVDRNEYRYSGRDVVLSLPTDSESPFALPRYHEFLISDVICEKVTSLD